MPTPLLLVALNAKYIHTNLAVRSLQAYVGSGASVYEAPQSEPIHKLAYQIFTLAPKNALVGFSCYLWNIDVVLQLCDRLKKMRGDIRIVLGGPEVSFDAEDVLRLHSAVDYVVSGEGELPLKTLVSALDRGTPDETPSLAYRRYGQIASTPAVPPLPLDALPFAYSEGVDGLEERIIYYESSRGCPFRCSFCLSAGTKIRYLDLSRSLRELSFFAGQNVKLVKLVDRTFNAAPLRARAIWRHLIELDTQTSFHFEVAAQLLEDADFELLARAPQGRFQFELGVQSTYAPARLAVYRNEPVEQVMNAVERLRKMDNIHLHLDLIAGLPGEGFAAFGQSYDQTAALKPHALQLGMLKALKGSGVRRDAEQFGLKFASQPPYDVISTANLSAGEVLRLTRMAEIASRFVYSGHAAATVALLRTKYTPFELLAEMESRLGDVPKEPQAIREALAAFAYTQGFDEQVLSDCLAYDWLLPRKRGYLPDYIGIELSDAQEQFARDFYRDRAPSMLPHLPQPAWRSAHLHPVYTDVPALLESGDICPNEGYLLFDYIQRSAVFTPRAALE